ncbi:hypothetical protein EDM68_05390 [Candidatus Uhrbacteria bacterium]|nr:MAG: hypothetical protein EDM68_05390 [Candidatus Uhrbacteria bacterium]
MWKHYTGRVTGMRLDGDPKVPATRWWNHLYLLLFVWREITILEVPEGAAPFRVGYKDDFGRAKCRTRPVYSRRFAVSHGHEPCTFFAVLYDGTEVPLRIVERTSIDRKPELVPLV